MTRTSAPPPSRLGSVQTFGTLSSWSLKTGRVASPAKPTAFSPATGTPTHPADFWYNADFSRGCSRINAALKIEPDHPSTFYATFPFRIIDVEGRAWIGGAVGCPMIMTSDWHRTWEHFDIEEVLLWNPRTGEVGILGEAASQPAAFVPERLALVEESLTVYGDGFSFFRAWADRRAITKARIAETKKHHVPADGAARQRCPRRPHRSAV